MTENQKLPNLRTHVRKRGTPNETTHYYYDMRGKGGKDIPLGSDRERALKKWKILRDGGSIDLLYPYEEAKEPKAVWVKLPKRLPVARKGEVRAFKGLEWMGMPDWARNLYLGAERRNKKRGVVEFISLYYFRTLIDRAGGLCELSGLEFVYDGDGRNPFSPSIDRIDSSIGYVEGNVRLVCLIANLGMSEWGHEPFIKLAKAIASKHK